MKEGGRLLLRECMATAVADLLPNIDYSDLTPFFSISPLFCGPSDSDNWQNNGLKLESEKAGVRFAGPKNKNCAHLCVMISSKQQAQGLSWSPWTWQSAQLHDGGRLLRLLLGGEARRVQRYISGDSISYSLEPSLNLDFAEHESGSCSSQGADRCC